MNMIKKTVILLVGIGLFLQRYACAQENQDARMEDKIIASTFKNIAKAYVEVSDIQQLKKNNIEKMEKMDEDRFRTRYAKYYEAIRALPPGIKGAYGINEEMNKQQVIEKIKSLNKNEICVLIDAVPDEIIAQRFKEYLIVKKKKLEAQESTILEQVRNFWERIVKRNS